MPTKIDCLDLKSKLAHEFTKPTTGDTPNLPTAQNVQRLVTTALPEPPTNLPKPVRSAWSEMQAHGWWLKSADRFVVQIAATMMARYRTDELTSGDVSLLIRLLGTIGFSPSERRKLNLPTEST
jgi:hypothetical protein